MYNVNLYKNTGFNLVNIPDNPALLGMPSSERPAVDLIQNRFLDSVTISCTSFEDVRDVDYCQVGDFYYFVTGITMKSRDVCTLKLVPDFITSAGGPMALEYLDGITERHHASTDEFGQYDEPDPYMNPTQPLELIINKDRLFNYRTDQANRDVTYVLATADLEQMGTDESKQGITYTDPVTGESVVVPHLIPVKKDTIFEMGLGSGKIGETYIKGAMLFDTNSEKVQEGMQYARDIGAESAILAQYVIPKDYGRATLEVETEGTLSYITGNANAEQTPDDLPFNFATVKNKRLLYGDNCNYGIITSNGNKSEFSPEQIYHEGDKAPSVLMATDPRPDGKPYFRFRYYLSSDAYAGEILNTSFWMNAIGGESWKEVPLVFTSKSGSIMDSYNFQSKQTMSQNTRNYQVANQVQGMVDTTVHGVANAIGSITEIANPFTKHKGGAIANLAMTAYDTGSSLLSQARTMDYTANQYELANQAELYNYGVQQSVVVPTVMFPYSSGTIRDYIGNGILCYRYRPTDYDLKRIDKILNMYGYKDTAPFSKEFLNNREYFNYIQVHGISIGGDLPQWWKSGIQSQLNAGVRIWHVTPSLEYYEDNPIKEV